MKISVECQIYSSTTAEIEIPVENWDDVKDWYVKWDTLHYTLDGEKWEEVELNSSALESDWKRPSSVDILSEEGEVLEDSY